MPRIATSQPLTMPKAEQHRLGRERNDGDAERGERQDRAHREVEPLGHDDQCHRQRQHGQDGRLHQHVGEVGGREEARRDRAEQHDQSAQHDGDAGNALERIYL
jgi:hypothetical protein